MSLASEKINPRHVSNHGLLRRESNSDRWVGRRTFSHCTSRPRLFLLLLTTKNLGQFLANFAHKLLPFPNFIWNFWLDWATVVYENLPFSDTQLLHQKKHSKSGEERKSWPHFTRNWALIYSHVYDFCSFLFRRLPFTMEIPVLPVSSSRRVWAAKDSEEVSISEW